MRKTLILALVIMGMAGCKETPKQPTTTIPPPPKVTEEMLQREKDLRAAAEITRDMERRSRQQWQDRTTFAVVCAILMLLIGTALGSRTRRDAQERK